MGLAYHLKRFRQNEIDKSRIRESYKKLDIQSGRLDWGLPLIQLPVMGWIEYQDRTKSGEALLLIDGVVYNVSGFISEHPGGEALIQTLLGKDARALFNGGVYDHSNAARGLLSTLRVAVLRGGCEVEVFKDKVTT